MLWSLFKILLFVAVVIALAFGAMEVMSLAGEIMITFAGNEYVLSPLMAVLGLLLLMLALWIVFKLAGLLLSVLRFINGDDTAISTYFQRNRERKGYEALSDSLIALASGEAREAASKASKAEKYLHRPEVTDIVMAQAAEAAGEREQAKEVYKRLVQRDRTRFVGVRGLMRQKLDEGDTATAMKLAEKAFALKPRHVETQDVLLKLQARDENWEGARKVLTAKLKSGALPKDVYKRREAVLSLADARARLADGDADAARAEAIEANRLSPELVPAAVLAARMHIEAGETRRAAKVIKAAWQKTHHPDLAAAFADIEPGETPDARIKRFQPLLKLDPDAPEAKMLEAELHLAAEDFPGARRALGKLPETHPTARSLSLMAAIERGEGASEAVVRAWLAKALGASRGPQWVCENCGTVHGSWLPICSSCEAFDTLEWTEPRRGETALSALPTDMLPLLTGPAVGEATGAPGLVPATTDAAAAAPGNGTAGPDDRDATVGAADPDVQADTVVAADGTITLPAGHAPPAPQDETPTTGGTSRM